MKSGLRQLVLCADDFGQSKAISTRIVELVGLRRLTAVSVMSEGPYWPQGSKLLSGTKELTEVGLHLNLTHAFPDGSKTYPLTRWLVLAPMRLVSRQKIRRLFLTQIDRFTDHFDRMPDFLDGHQHVHAFPVIRDALFDAIAERWPTDQPLPWVRAPERLADPGDLPLKARVLRVASAGFSDDAARHGLSYPNAFCGLYSLRAEGEFEPLMRRWLSSIASGTLLMCHPGGDGSDRADPIAKAREVEFSYLCSPRFLEDCQGSGVELVRYRDLLSPPPELEQVAA
jgi:chitin disaccharide deacetylase